MRLFPSLAWRRPDMGATDSALYIGRVFHARFRPMRHKFSYRVFSLLLDLDVLPELDRRLRLFAWNRPGVLSFHNRDHGDGSGRPLRGWVTEQLEAAGLGHAAHSIRLFCFPRLWGYVFNPLAIYYCHDSEGRLAATIQQVSNTFGERHSYVLPVAENNAGARTVRQASAKRFHVSPFFPVEGGYRFRMTAPGERLTTIIRYQDPTGADLLLASHVARRAPLTDARLALAIALNPLMTLKVTVGIHWEAARLWLKGALYHRKPAPPVEPATIPRKVSPAAEELAHG